MTTLENIRSAEEAVATVQHHLDQVQQVLAEVEQVAVVADSARRRTPAVLLTLVGVTLVAVAARYLVLRARERRQA
jgi:hypothetical protein